MEDTFRSNGYAIIVEAFEIGRNWIPDVQVIGDAKLLKTLTEGLHALKVSRNLTGPLGASKCREANNRLTRESL